MIEPLDRTGTWRTYSTADGLPGVRMEHIAEDGEGYLWFATWENGASRFDGDEFRNFTEQDGLAHHRVNTISMDGQNRLWFGTSNGVCWYDGANFHPSEYDGTGGRTDGRAGDPKRQFPFPSTDGEIVPLVEHERRYILSVLEATNWRIKGARGAAKLLGLPPSTLYGKMKKLGIKNHTK